MDKRQVAQAVEYSRAGYTIIRLKGKLPLQGWRKYPYTIPSEVPAACEGWENFGVALGKEDLVLDVDPRHFKPGDKPHVRLFEELGVTEVSKTAAIVKTGGGGMHVYWKLPEGFTRARETHKAYPGLEFKQYGRQVVGATSTHPETKQPYLLLASSLPLKDVQLAPQALLEWLAMNPAPVKGAQGPDLPVGVGDTDPNGIQGYTHYLQTVDPTVSGFVAACKGRDYGLSMSKTRELMATILNPRASAPWADEDLKDKIRNAYKYASGQAGAELPAAAFDELPVEADQTPVLKSPMFRGWDMGNDGPKKTINNCANFFLVKSSLLNGMLVYNEFAGQVRVMKRPPWWPASKILPKDDGVEWSDNDSVNLRLWLGREKRFDAPITLIDQAVLAVAQMNRIHPLRDWLSSLSWDGKPRLDSWLIKYARAKDDAYVRSISRLALMQAVARVYNPGAKADHVLILEGRQGCGKSTLIEILGGKFYADFHIDPRNKDTVDAMRGKWIIEFSELAGMNIHDAQSFKAFISRRTDRVRLAYGRNSVDLPRQCIFIGSTNPDATTEYLNDTTGNRRAWPVGVGKVDFEGLAGARDQLFAEAVEAVLKGEAVHITDEKVVALAVIEQKSRQNTDPWQHVIEDWLVENPRDFISSRELWEYALRGNHAQFGTHHARRIAACLHEIGFEKHVQRVDALTLKRGFLKKGKELGVLS